MRFILSLIAFIMVSCGGDFSQEKAVSDPVEVVEDGCACNSCECSEDSCVCSDCECPGPVCCEDGCDGDDCDGDDCAMGACDCDPGCDCGCGEDGDSDCGEGSCPIPNWIDCREILYSVARDGSLGDRLRCL